MFEGFGETPEEAALQKMINRAKEKGAAGAMTKQEAMDAFSKLNPAEIQNAFRLIARYEQGV